MEIADLFAQLNNHNIYKLIDSPAPLQMYYGIDDKMRLTFMLETITKPSSFKPTKCLNTFLGFEQTEGKYCTYISLEDASYKNLFFIVIDDLILAAEKSFTEAEAIQSISNRYFGWKNLFGNNHDLLSPSIIEGLYGEMSFLDSLIDKYGAEKAVDSWTGPTGSDKDFSYDSKWFEIKTTSTKSNQIEISSINQLDSKNPGRLVVYVVERIATASTEKNASINTLFNSIMNKLEKNATALAKFSLLLNSLGYIPDPAYEEYKYNIKKQTFYIVDEHFPRLTKKDLPSKAISKVKYSILLNFIEDYIDGKPEL